MWHVEVCVCVHKQNDEACGQHVSWRLSAHEHHHYTMHSQQEYTAEPEMMIDVRPNAMYGREQMRSFIPSNQIEERLVYEATTKVLRTENGSLAGIVETEDEDSNLFPAP